MNLARVLDVSLPDLPRQQFREARFRYNPETIAREHKEPKGITIITLSPGTRKVHLLSPAQFEMVKMFDGRRSYEEVAALWRRKCNVNAPPEAIQKFAESLDANGFWLKTPQEESVALANDLAEGRRTRSHRGENKFGKVYVWVFDPEKVLSRAYHRLRWVWHPAFVLASIAALILMVGLWIARWDEVWRDSVLYWNMTEKTLIDVLEFYLAFLIIGFFHESGHAFTAKHFGAEVHRSGIMLVYTTPAFFVDSSEVWVYGSRMPRIYTILAGFWFELMLCAVATFVWWATSAGSNVHDLAYKIILVGGIMPVLFNMNPLMRLDGYLCFCEIVRIQNLKEKSTLFLSNWVQKHILRLPVVVPILPRRRAIFFATFAFLSGVYTYFILGFLARLTYKILYNFTPEWAFLPAALVALRVFKSRIVKFAAFLKTLYLAKREVMWAQRKKWAPVGAAVLLLLFVPVRREEVSAPFVLEPVQRAVLRAQVPGLVQHVAVREGDVVAAGAAIATLRDIETETRLARAASDFRSASDRAVDAQLRYADFATADQERSRAQKDFRLATERRRMLDLTSPIAGTIVTPRVQDVSGSWIQEGTTIAEIQDVSTLRARVYVIAPEMRILSEITGARLHVGSQLGTRRGTLASISAAPQPVDAGLIPGTRYAGLQPPPYYVATILLDNSDGALRAGMSGEAKLLGVRRSIAGSIWRPIRDFIGRKFW